MNRTAQQMSADELAEAMVGAYGRSWRRGVVLETLGEDPRIKTHRLSNGSSWVTITGSTRPAERVLCGELVEIATEDGPISGRCGERTLDSDALCGRHAEIVASWRAEDEAAQR